MSTPEIRTAIDATLNDLRERVDALDHDEIDTETGDGKLVIELGAVKLIVSRQSAADQIWLAEPEGGWHFDYRDGSWIDHKRGVELMASIEELLRKHLGEPVKIV